MRTSRNNLFTWAAITAAMLLCASFGWAADEEVETDEDATGELEEIIVYAYKPGDKVDVDARYEELFRSRASTELARLKVLDEEFEWRKSMSENRSTSRIKWGYDPEAEQSMRRDTSLTDLSFETHKPATVFRVQF
jgi:hypothetical protein